MARTQRARVVTFQADAELLAAMRRVPNRSEFIRNALMAALGGSCPVCNGAGSLTASQKAHWDAFAAAHSAQTCSRCSEVQWTCAGAKPPEHAHAVYAGNRAKGRRKES